MGTLPAILVSALAICNFAAAQEDTVQLAESFRSHYAGDDATGDHVIALWQFDEGAEGADVSGNGHDLELNGAKYVADGRFGGGLESARGWPVEDKPHQAYAENAPQLTPKGAFTIELWIKARPELEGYPEAFLIDNKYVAQTGYQLTLSPETGTGTRVLYMRLGFGEDTVAYSSNALACEPDVWRHIAFTYDGAGTGRFFVDGQSMGSDTQTGRASIAPGGRPLYIGDRVGSYYHGFPGVIDQVRICDGALEFRPAGFELLSQRAVFVRMEESPILEFAVTNRQRTSLRGGWAYFALAGLPRHEVPVPDLESGERHVIKYELDASIRPDAYELLATIDVPGEERYTSTEEFTITIVPRPLPERMPVVMWGAGLGEIDRLTDLGFTHAIGVSADFNAIWEAGEPTAAGSPESVSRTMAELDDALANDVRAVAGLSPGRWARGKEEFRRVKPDGEINESNEDVCGLFPEVQDFWRSLVQDCLDAGVDGVDFRIHAHSTHTDEPFAYGFNKPIVEAYLKRYGVDITEDEHGPKLLADLRGEYYTEFLRSASSAIRGAGKKMQVHMATPQMFPERAFAIYHWIFPCNTTYDWERWLAEGLADEVTIRCPYVPPRSLHESPFTQQVIAACRAKGIPLHFNRYLPPFDELKEEIEIIRRDGRFRSFVLYEGKRLIGPDGKGGVTLRGGKHGDMGEWLQLRGNVYGR